MSFRSPVLYSFRRCPYAMRARLALVYAGVEVEIREVVLKDKPQALLELSSKATVPVLQLTDGRVLDESMDIMYWSLAQYDPQSWLSLDVGEVEQIKCLISRNDLEFKPWLDKYKYHDRHPQNTQPYYREQAECFLQQLDDKLQHQRFLFRGIPGLADMAIFPFIRQFAHVDSSWFEESRYKNVLVWLKTLLSTDMFATTMQKYPAWKEGDAARYFP